MSERTLPHDLDAERSVLGAILIGGAGQWTEALTAVSAGEFFRVAHSRIFLALGRLASAGKPCDFILLADELRRAGELDECGGLAYISALTDGVPRSTNVQYYAGIVAEKARLRQLIYASSQIAAAAYLDERPSDQLIDEALRTVAGVSKASTADSAMIVAGEAVRQYRSALIEGTLSPPIASGHAELDELLAGGFQRQDLVIVAARPSVGKSSLAYGIADHVAGASAGEAVIFDSLEMSRRQLASRRLSWRCGVTTSDMERGRFTAEQGAAIWTASEQKRPDGTDDPLLLLTSGRTLTDIWAWCRRVKEERGLAMVVVDYIQLVASPVRTDSREREVAAISAGLKAIAKDLDIVVLALSQLSRAPKKGRNLRPTLSDLRESGALEQDADVAVLIYRLDMVEHATKKQQETAQESRTPEGHELAEIILAKQRMGPVGVAKMAFQKELARFRDLTVPF